MKEEIHRDQPCITEDESSSAEVQQVSAAQKLARECLAKNYKDC